jgi:hypothetical protein
VVRVRASVHRAADEFASVLVRVVVHNSQRTEPAAVCRTGADKILVPALIASVEPGNGNARATRQTFPLSGAHAQPFISVEAVDPASRLNRPGQALLAEAGSNGRELAQPLPQASCQSSVPRYRNVPMSLE